MEVIVIVLILLIALEHLYFMYFEMFAWETIGKKTFRSLPEHIFSPTKKLAANQGLYNGFLAAGLIWSILISDPVWSKNVAMFFLVCVSTAGVYGGMTAGKKVFYFQGVPAIICIILIGLLKVG